MSLTDARLRALRGRSSPFKVADGEGLYVLVAPKGSRLWRLAYRYLGKQKTLALGKYPQMTLLTARRARDEAKRQLACGSDPAANRKRARREKLISAGNTFEAIANEWFALNESRWVKTYASRLRGRLDGDLLPAIGKRPITEIEPLEVLDAIRAIEKRDAIEMAKRVMQMASGVFRYGVATAKCRRDPTVDLRGALQPAKPAKNRTSLPATELPQFMEKLENYDGDEVTKLGLELLVLTFVRTGELRFARRPEFENLDGPNALWRIPSERMKMRRPHLVPLAPRTVTVVCRLQALAGKSEFLFPADTKAGVISENTLLFALYRMGYHKRATVHGFRSTASTILNEAEFNRDWVEMQLAHFDGSVRGVYNAAEWLSGRREMMTWWSQRLSPTARLRLVS